MSSEAEKQRRARRVKLSPGDEITCPRCGQKGIVEVVNVGGRRYYRVRHYDPNTHNKTYHYLGPVEGYANPGKTQGVLLTSLRDWRPDLTVLSIIDTAKRLYEHGGMNQGELKNALLRLKMALEEGMTELDKLLKEIEAVEEEGAEREKGLLEAKA